MFETILTLILISFLVTLVGGVFQLDGLPRQVFFLLLRRVNFRNFITKLNKKRGVFIGTGSIYNPLTKRYDLESFSFVTTEKIIAKISKHNETHKNKLCYVMKIHTGCMGDHATVILRDGSNLLIDENALTEASLFEMILFMLSDAYRLTHSRTQRA